MPWFQVDDGFANSKPVMRIPRRWRAPCIGAWTLCGSWSAKELTDGFVPDAVLEEYGATPKIIELLIGADLWEKTKNDGLTGINFRNWQKWQRTKQQVLDYRAAETERKRSWRDSKKQAADQHEENDVPDMSRRDTSVRPASVPPSVPDVSALPIPKPTPNQVSTSLTLVEGGPGGDPQLPVAAKAAPAARGTRLPTNWRPDDKTIQEMAQRFPNVALKLEHEKFTNYWRAQPGAKGRKSDWPSTWRNWIIRASEQAPRAPNGHSPPNGIGKPSLKALGYQALTDQIIAEMGHE